MGSGEILQEALKVTALGMGTVLVTLYILSLLLNIMERVLNKQPVKNEKNKVIKKQKVEKVEEVADNDDEQLVAVIAAALSKYLDKPIYTLKIGSIRQIHKTTPNWGMASRIDNINNKL